MNYKSKLTLNTISSLILQISTIICGFIMPCLILSRYGSEINGLASSIINFLGAITLLELGMGAVIQYSLYKPLAEHDNFKISTIMVSASIFYRKLAMLLIVYVVLLCLTFPFVINTSFDWLFTVELILATSMSLFAQYYFGIVNSFLLNSSQRGYINYNVQSVTLVLTTAICAFLIDLGASIQLVRFVTSILYFIRPVYISWYVNKNFNINYDVKYSNEPIKHKWNGIAQHVAAVLFSIIPIFVLTVCGSLKDVSVFCVYFLVVNGIKSIVVSLTNGVHALMGEMWAKQEFNNLNKLFSWTEWSIHTFSMYVFGCTAILIVPFISVYTAGVNDTNYYQPLFGIVLVFAHLGHCLRLPYNLMILAAGHYKETQSNYIIATITNFFISVLCTIFWGIEGVAVGAMVALYYQVFWMSKYVSEYLIEVPLKRILKQFYIDGISMIFAIGIAYYYIDYDVKNYFDWIFLALKVMFLWGLIVIGINFVAYKEKIKILIYKIINLKVIF